MGLRQVLPKHTHRTFLAIHISRVGYQVISYNIDIIMSMSRKVTIHTSLATLHGILSRVSLTEQEIKQRLQNGRNLEMLHANARERVKKLEN